MTNFRQRVFYPANKVLNWARELLSFRAELQGLSITIALCIGVVIVGHVVSNRLTFKSVVNEVDQILHHDYAARFVPLIAPLMHPELDCNTLRPVLHQFEKQSGRFKLYILDKWGVIRCSTKDAAEQGRYKTMRLGRVLRLIVKKERAIPALLGDPRAPSTEKPFSVAEFEVMGKRPWYLVAIMDEHDLVADRGGFQGVQHISRYNRALLFILGFILSLVVGRRLLTRKDRLRAKITSLNKQLEKQRERNEQEQASSLSRQVVSMADTLVAEMRAFGIRQEDKQTFIASLSHDLKSPLSAIKGYVETLLKEGDPTPSSSYNHNLEVIASNLDHVTSLIRQILELGTFDELLSSKRLVECDLNQCLSQVYRAVVPIAAERSVNLQLQIPEGKLPASGDKTLLIRALTNLVHNALKFTPPDGTVTLSAALEADKVNVRVEDTGSGILERDLPHIFGRFYRGERTRKDKNGSAGLGLYIVRRIIEAHAGTVEVEKTSELGSTFCVKLPLLR